MILLQAGIALGFLMVCTLGCSFFTIPIIAYTRAKDAIKVIEKTGSKASYDDKVTTYLNGFGYAFLAHLLLFVILLWLVSDIEIM